MKAFIFFSFISLHLLAANLPQNSTSKSKQIEAKCTVDGHGPYDLNYTKCMQLGSDQAHTNCVLKAKESHIELIFTSGKKKRSATCIAKPKIGTEDCQKAQCYLAFDTPQQ